VRGMLTSPELERAQEHAQPSPTWHDFGEVLSFFTTRRKALSFWSEQWLSREALLTRIVERLRSTRIATALEVDDGWYGGRDVSVLLGRWGRLDVQMLVEEHERGKTLVRIARRLRVTPFFAAGVGSLVALTVSWMTASTGGWLMLVPMVLSAALMLRALWHGVATVSLADAVMTQELLDARATPLEESAIELARRIITSRQAQEQRPSRAGARRMLLTASALRSTATTAEHAS
jgi:hypothetical protein